MKKSSRRPVFCLHSGTGFFVVRFLFALFLFVWFGVLEGGGEEVFGGAGEVVWASQETLAKRYDMSKSNLCRLLMAGVTNGKIRMLQPNGVVRKYHVNDVDAYMLDISDFLDRSVGTPV